MLLNNKKIEEIKKEIKICIEMNENENKTTPNLWDSIKALLRGRSIAIQENKRKTNKKPETREKSNKPTLHPKKLEKEEMKNPRVSRRKEIIKN